MGINTTMKNRLLLLLFLASPVFAQYPPTNQPTQSVMVFSGNGRMAGSSSNFFLNSIAVANVWDFGAYGNGLTDDTAAIQAAIYSGAGTVYFPPATFLYSSLTITNAVIIKGSGALSTALRTTGPTGNAITVSTTQPVIFEDILLGGTNVSQSGGALVLFQTGTSTYNQFSEFHNVYFQAPYIGADFETACTWLMDKMCVFVGYGYAGVKVVNTVVPDCGDSEISGNCVFNGQTNNSMAIYQLSSGGLKIHGNKFLGGAYHYYLAANSAASGTGIMMFQDNSSEAASVDNIYLSAVSGSSWNNVLIQDNQFSVTGSNAIFVADNGSIGWLDNTAIGGNDFKMSSTTNGGITLAGGQRYTIYPNHFISEGGSFSTGITISSNAISGTIYPQAMFGLSTNFVGDYTNWTWMTFTKGSNTPPNAYTLP